MKYLLPILFFLFAPLAFTQSFDYKLLRYNDLDFYSKKTAIIDRLGKPDSIMEPNYQCGFLSEAEQGNKYYSLHYTTVVFTGNDDEGYLLESLVFETGISLQYGRYVLSSTTTVADLTTILGDGWDASMEDKVNGTVIIGFGDKADDGLRIFLKNGLLVKIRYWSPC